MLPAAPSAKVLLVDDDERNLLALSEVLSPVAEVVCSGSGADALRQLLREEFAVILLDVFMPGMDGYETAAIIRERDQTARTPIIFLSAVNKETEHLMRGYEMGAVDYVFKPVDPLIIKSKVSVFVDLFRTHRKLEESEKRQASILRSLPMAIYEMSERDGQVRREFRGGDLRHFLGDETFHVQSGAKQWHEWVHPEDRDRLHQKPNRGGDTVTVEYRWMGPQGRLHHILDQRICTANGSARRWAGSLLDITERKELEAKLVHAGKLDALGQLTGGVAHDFNNLLAAVLGGIEFLQRKLTLGEREERVVQQMRHAATQGTELVRRMMAFARQQDLSPTIVNPSSLCDSVAGLVSHTLGGKVRVEWDCPKVDLNFFVDRSQLELALMNLIINARDAMPDGGTITVEIKGEHDASVDKQMLCIRVTDQGTGIPEDALARVTEPFFTTKEAGKGTGLGLSMVSGFVHQSGGKFSIASTVGHGTTIELLLPATADQAGRDQTGEVATLEWLEGKRLLLIDDDKAVRTVLHEQFRDAGSLVEAYESGDAAVTAVGASEQEFDFILSDFAMPGMDGLEAIKRLTLVSPGARAVLMTGNADDPKLIERDGIVPIIRKPIRLELLRELFLRADA